MCSQKTPAFAALTILGFLALDLALSPAGGQPPPHDWSAAFGGSGRDMARAVAVDAGGNVIVTGYFEGTLFFGSLGDVVPVSQGGRDVFVTKFDPAGELLWAKGYGSVDEEAPTDVAVDGDGNIYVTGTFLGTVDFGGGPLVCQGMDDIFLVKLDPSGNHLWSQRYGDSDRDLSGDIAVDGSSHVYLTGQFRGAVDFGGGPLANAGGWDIFLAKIKGDGVHGWSQSYGTSQNDAGTSVFVNGDRDVILTGQSAGPVSLGGPPLPNAGNTDVFLAKIDQTGAHVWSQSFGGTGRDAATAVAVDPSNYITITGTFSNSVDFGGGPIASNGALDVFVARYDTNGLPSWSQGFGDADDDLGLDVAVNANKEIHVTGTFHDTIDFGGGFLFNHGGEDIFLAKFKNNGTHLWSHSFGDDDDDFGLGVAADASYNVFLAGAYQGWVSFGGSVIGSWDATLDAFAAGFDQSGNHAWSERFGTGGVDVGSAVAIDDNDNVITTGTLEGTVDFGTGPIVCRGRTDIFLLECDSKGDLLWLHHFGDAGDDVGSAVAVDPAGNIILAGIFDETIDFGGGPLVGSGETFFAAKFDPSGNHLWSRAFAGGSGTVSSIGVDGAGNVVLAGYYWGTVDFGGGPIASAGNADMFIVSLDGSGIHRWSHGFGGPEYDVCLSTAVDDAGTAAVTGTFRQSIDFGGGPLVSAGDSDIFVARFNAAGGHVWSRSFGGPDADGGFGIAYNGSGRVVVTGRFRDTVNFGGGPLVDAGNSDVFLARYDAGGGHIWSQRFGDTGSDYVDDIATDDSGEILLSGHFGGSMDFGGGPLNSEGEWDIYLAKFKSSGVYLWSTALGGPGDDVPFQGVADGAGNVAVTGYFRETIDFGGGALQSHEGTRDVFIAKFTEGASGLEPLEPFAGRPLALTPPLPNPSTGNSVFALDLRAPGRVDVAVFETTGRRIRTILTGVLDAGRHAVGWDGRDASGRMTAPGVYLLRAESSGIIVTRKVTRLD